MKPLPLTFFVLFVFGIINAQNVSNRLNNFKLENSSAAAINWKTEISSPADIDRLMRQSFFQHADSQGIIIVDDGARINKVPAIFWGIGTGALYMGGTYLLFGDLSNAGYPGLIGSSLAGILIGTIVNQAKREHIIKKRKATLPKRF